MPRSAIAKPPLRLQVYRQLRAAIEQGSLQPGARLPPSRVHAASLKVSRNTVLWALERLQAEGYVIARVGDGSYVAPDLTALRARPVRRAPLQPVLSRRGCLGLSDTCPRVRQCIDLHQPKGRCRTSLEGGNRGARHGGCRRPGRYGDWRCAAGQITLSDHVRCAMGVRHSGRRGPTRRQVGRICCPWSWPRAYGHESARPPSGGGCRRVCRWIILRSPWAARGWNARAQATGR